MVHEYIVDVAYLEILKQLIFLSKQLAEVCLNLEQSKYQENGRNQ